jgi:hypothetical protein
MKASHFANKLHYLWVAILIGCVLGGMIGLEPVRSMNIEMAGDVPAYRVMLPVVMKNWPPIPTIPNLLPINNADQDNYYTVSWQNTGVGEAYKLEESADANFSAPTLVYQGSNTVWLVPQPGQISGRFLLSR